MRLIIAEKPSFYHRLDDCQLIPDNTDVVFTYSFGLWRFAMPKLSFSDVPFTDEPDKLRSWPMWSSDGELDYDRHLIRNRHNGNLRDYIWQESGWSQQELEEALNHLVQELTRQCPNYEEIICAVDADRTGYGSAKQIIDQIPADILPPVHCLYLTHGLGKEQLSKAWNERKQNLWTADSQAQTWATERHLKYSFDYWWNSNAALVLSELCKWTGLKADPIVSKYELMLLAIMAQQDKPISDGGIMALLQDWQGSGRYPDLAQQVWGIGSPASRPDILTNAINRGAIERLPVAEGEKISRCQLSELGHAFIDGLHKKTFDPDLPFRLEEWIVAGNKSAMQRYIRQVFGRQLRYQRNHIAPASAESRSA